MSNLPARLLTLLMGASFSGTGGDLALKKAAFVMRWFAVGDIGPPPFMTDVLSAGMWFVKDVECIWGNNVWYWLDGYLLMPKSQNAYCFPETFWLTIDGNHI
jgi:hypothetical protein